jgi:hypothetical protein
MLQLEPKFMSTKEKVVRALSTSDTKFLALKGAKRVRFLKWQLAPNGSLLSELPRFFEDDLGSLEAIPGGLPVANAASPDQI